ncbi:unnamed protein product, partial [Schistosoma turkestanicum]
LSSIRSAASHRRAMKLFEEAEKRRQSENFSSCSSSNMQILSTSSTPVSSVRSKKVHSSELANNTNNNNRLMNSDIHPQVNSTSSSSGPVLTPAVVPVMSAQRLIPGKISAK